MSSSRSSQALKLFNKADGRRLSSGLTFSQLYMLDSCICLNPDPMHLLLMLDQNVLMTLIL